MSVALSFDVDDADFLHVLHETADDLDRLIAAIADDLRVVADEESASKGVTWQTDGASIVAEQWWAHFPAHGTKAHGPRIADRLVFEVDGEVVFASFVKGVAPDGFDARAVEREASRVDDVMRRVVESLS